ncbi:MAG: bifunctional methylenetetrahydrofolate dehydrogenase/methenyltetrahydrofolate cyclohydrolase FolD [Clostridia bacterium]|nr:bifunctional methylenetetrahydrofolate dehydrogenase/methenyltetrahydrofolate cyclohydrolase FolD [Clostridia bacterium]
MPAKIIDGKALSLSIREQMKSEAERFETTFGRKVGLAVIKVGANPASEVYVRNKIKACEDVGVRSFSYNLPEEIAESDVMDLIDELNANESVDGILVQLPLPKTINEKKVLARILPEKDADGFHTLNAGGLMLGLPCTKPCTPAGIIELIKSTGVAIAGKNVVVIGRSNIVGKPVAMLLLSENATVTICHSRTVDLKSHTLNADILVVAVGIKEFVTGDMVKDGAVVIDVGMNRADGKLYGDVNYPEAVEKASFITPVPGGVGPMTVTMLIKNTIESAFRCKEN